jgi:hypothetical protein
MVSAIIILQRSLAIDRPSELAAPDNQSLVQQAALFQVCYQCSLRLIDIVALFRDIRRKVTVVVPSSVI